MNEQYEPYLTYDKIAKQIDTMIETIEKEKFTAIAVIVQGGLFPAQLLSIKTGIPLYFLKKTQYSKSLMWLGAPAPTGKLLLVDDVFDKYVVSQTRLDTFIAQGYDLKTLSVLYPENLDFHPDYYAFLVKNESVALLLPWKQQKSACPVHQQASTHSLVETESVMTVWDMECIRSYRQIIEESESVAIEDCPMLKVKDAFLLTGNSLCDEKLIQWLQTIGVTPRICRYSGNVPIETLNDYALALWKGQKLIELGCQRYVESHAEQAIMISKQIPHIDIIWWNAGTPVSIKSSSFSF